MVLNFSHSEFCKIGLKFAGNWSDDCINALSHATTIRRMYDFFGASPKTISKLYRDVQDPVICAAPIAKPNPLDLLGGLYFLKKYPTKIAQAGFVGCCEKTGLAKAWRYVEAIQSLKENTIKWIFDDPEHPFEEMFILSVDGVHCRTYEPRFVPSSGWYSTKFNKAGLAYELGVAVYHDKICWMNGPFPAGQSCI